MLSLNRLRPVRLASGSWIGNQQLLGRFPLGAMNVCLSVGGQLPWHAGHAVALGAPSAVRGLSPHCELLKRCDDS